MDRERMTTLVTTPRARPFAPTAVSQGGWVHLCGGLDPVREGGMIPSILGMTGALARRTGRGVTIHSTTAAKLGETLVGDGLTLLGPEADLETLVRGAGVVHTHGLWQSHARRGTKAARAARVPYLMAAHGHAEPWALRHKGWKKAVYTALVEGKNLRHAACLHALSRPEIGHLRALAPQAKVCFVPNGVDLAPLSNLPGREVLEAEFPHLAGKFLLLFYGRLDVKKGLDLLAQAVPAVAADRPDLHVLLAGHDSGALGPFLKQCEVLGIESRVTRLGHVSGERARQVWGAADAFALPSYSEGFSMAILEALACSLPVLATTACHFPELGREGAGVVVEPTAEGVTSGLRQVLEMSTGERLAMGRRGRGLVEREYTWDRQADRLAAVYGWLSGGGPEPEAVADAEGPTRTFCGARP